MVYLTAECVAFMSSFSLVKMIWLALAALAKEAWLVIASASELLAKSCCTVAYAKVRTQA